MSDSINEFQFLSTRTLDFVSTDDVERPGHRREQLAHMALGLAGEAGETVDLLKKHLFYGKDLDKYKLKEELGDIMFYLASIATLSGIALSDVLVGNLKKLEKRYPKGFSKEDALKRKDQGGSGGEEESQD